MHSIICCVIVLSVTLLFANAVAMEALPIALDYIVPSWAAIVLSVAFVLVFCEMIPQALCVTNPLQICAQTAWIVKLLQVWLKHALSSAS